MAYDRPKDKGFELELNPRKVSNLSETVQTGYVGEESVKHNSIVDQLRKQFPTGEKYLFKEDAKSNLKSFRGVGYVGVVSLLVCLVILMTVILVTRDDTGGEPAGHAEARLEKLNEATPGGWGPWSSYSDCSQTCGGGSQNRLRWCDSPRPNNGGRWCEGKGKEARFCNMKSCPENGVWGIWSSWGTCTATCNNGTQTRGRECTWPGPVHGQNCTGAKTETRDCRREPCQVDGDWGQWKAWGACSSSCDTGTKVRYRDCVFKGTGPFGADCLGSDQETLFCSINSCTVDGVWTQWTNWGVCLVTCALGVQERTRTCSYVNPVAPKGKNCTGNSLDTRPCKALLNCPADGVWEAWTSWSDCSATCGGGFQIRKRKCFFPLNATQGYYCSGRSTGAQACNPQNCTTNIYGEWGQWGAWGACSSSCGTGTKVRYRDCVYEGTGPHEAECQGPSQEGTFCSTNACPVDGVWSPWTNWGDCSVTCDIGVQGRTRTCSYPDSVSPLGESCAGTRFETKLCSRNACKG